MSNLVHLLEAPVFAAATAIARRRFGPDADRADILQYLSPETFERVVDEARAALAAVADLNAVPLRRATRALHARDAAALGLDLGAHALVILARDLEGRLTGAYWARGLLQNVAHHASAALAPAWNDATQALTPPAAVRAGSSSSSTPEQP